MSTGRSTSKSILVFCDGTQQDGLVSWEIPEEFKESIHKYPRFASNVFRLSRCVAPFAADGNPQVVMYQSGVAVADNFEGDNSHKRELITGIAVASKIRDAYNFIAQNFVSGDKIYLFGFSRGAFTARKVAGLIDSMGLLDKKDMSNFFMYWRDRYKLQPGARAPPKRGRNVQIEFLGVWDTVGSIQEFGYYRLEKKLDILGLRDTSLPECVQRVCHGLAYHEERDSFMCLPFTPDSNNPSRLSQVWFPGVHSDVGGSYKEHEIADISLLWMAGEVHKAGVNLDIHYLDERLSNASSQLTVHFEHFPISNSNRRDIFEMTLEQGARCHPSLWARLAHPESRRTHWENTGLDQDLMVQEPIELNEIEEKFWKDRWAWTIHAFSLDDEVSRGSSYGLPPQTHPAPEEDESPECLFDDLTE